MQNSEFFFYINWYFLHNAFILFLMEMMIICFYCCITFVFNIDTANNKAIMFISAPSLIFANNIWAFMGTSCSSVGFYHPLDGITNLEYKLMCFLTPNKKISKRNVVAFNWDRCCHLELCLQLILFHLQMDFFLALRL